jgi:hypothetical protein
MRRKFSFGSRLVIAILLMAGLVVWPVAGISIASAEATGFSGRATVVKGTVVGLQVGPLADTGDISSSGGALEASLLQYPVPGEPDATNGALTAEVLSATVIAQGNRSRAQATVAAFSLNEVGQSITAEFLNSEAEANCQGSRASVSGSSEIVDLVINGAPITVSGQANQTVALPGGGVVIINEQTGSSASANNGDITVNALHIKIPGVIPGTDTDLIVASAHADISCAGAGCPKEKDFVTSGGFVIAPSGAKGSFGAAGGIKNGNFWGHLVYEDHGTGLRAKGTGVTAYVVTGTTSRHIEGTCEINGVSGTYALDVADNGEPGTGVDDFRLTLSNGYTASGKLAGGNIQLHTCK